MKSSEAVHGPSQEKGVLSRPCGICQHLSLSIYFIFEEKPHCSHLNVSSIKMVTAKVLATAYKSRVQA